MILRRLAATTMYASLTAATALSLAWVLVTDNDVLESTAQLFGLTAALTGIVAERLANEWQRRKQAITALTDELVKNKEIIDDLRRRLGGAGRRRVHPRLLLSAADGVITSGVLATGNRERVSLLHQWRNEVADFNRRLDLTEMLTFLQGTPEVLRDFEQALNRADGRLARVGALLDDLLALLTESHADRRRSQASPARTPEKAVRRAVEIRVPVRRAAGTVPGAAPVSTTDATASIPLPTPQRDDCGERQPMAG